ncbi:MAG: stage V sporulation protein AC [Clostridia bacterium]|jgi:stage V sporulation protein AC|nr:stage V sporulation protein AC [Clostridiaceae bacterium]
MQKLYSAKDYQKYVDKKSPNSKLGLNMLKAFLTGGLICMLGQLLMNYFQSRNLDQMDYATLTAMCLILLSVILTALDIYIYIGKFGGAGASIPITGFANAIVSPAMEFKTEGYVLGVGAKMFLIAGPVLVYGISSSVILGILYYILK